MFHESASPLQALISILAAGAAFNGTTNSTSHELAPELSESTEAPHFLESTLDEEVQVPDLKQPLEPDKSENTTNEGIINVYNIQ